MGSGCLLTGGCPSSHGSVLGLYGEPVIAPTMRALLDDPAYRRYIRVIPRLPEHLSSGHPWAVYAVTAGRWRGATFATYPDAWGVVVRAVRNPAVDDVAIVSRRMLFAPTALVRHVIQWGYEWCARCRRPSMFELYNRHHALPGVPINPAEPRCTYCGVRREYVRDSA